VEQELTQVNVKSPQDEVGHAPKLDAQLKYLFRVVSAADAPPTKPAYEVLDRLAADTERLLTRARAGGRELQSFSARLADLHVGALGPLQLHSESGVDS